LTAAGSAAVFVLSREFGGPSFRFSLKNFIFVISAAAQLKVVQLNNVNLFEYDFDSLKILDFTGPWIKNFIVSHHIYDEGK
jgi:hypothetical protein